MDSATAQTHLDAWLAADLAVAQGQSYTIGNRSLTRADAETIRTQIQFYTGLRDIALARESNNRNPRASFVSWGS